MFRSDLQEKALYSLSDQEDNDLSKRGAGMVTKESSRIDHEYQQQFETCTYARTEQFGLFVFK